MGQVLKVGNNVTVNLEPDTRVETDRLYTGLQVMPWGYWGCTLDRFGVRWMFNCYEPKA